jgi:hypothetical protein
MVDRLVLKTMETVAKDADIKLRSLRFQRVEDNAFHQENFVFYLTSGLHSLR